jgi:hypothetical protein
MNYPPRVGHGEGNARRGGKTFSPNKAGGANKNNGPREHGPRASCVALIEARYLQWLLETDSENAEPVSPAQVAGLLQQALAANGRSLDIQRVYWYADAPATELVDGLITRMVAADDDQSSAQAIESDLRAVAEHKSFAHVVLASDANSLRDAVDAAQQRGLLLHLLTDESAQDFAATAEEDPAWAQLLAQADSRLWFRPSAWQHRATRGPKAQDVSREEPRRDEVQAVVREWWESRDEDTRADILASVQVNRGIPQEIDRELLGLARDRLDRPLNLEEKRIMRDALRTNAGV